MVVLNRRGRPNNELREGEVYIGRGTKWGNPYVIGADGDRTTVIKKYKRWLFMEATWLVFEARAELRNRSLVCWCAPEPCHGDVLNHIANCDENEWRRIQNWITDKGLLEERSLDHA